MTLKSKRIELGHSLVRWHRSLARSRAHGKEIYELYGSISRTFNPLCNQIPSGHNFFRFNAIVFILGTDDHTVRQMQLHEEPGATYWQAVTSDLINMTLHATRILILHPHAFAHRLLHRASKTMPCPLGRLKSNVSFQGKFSIRGRKFYKVCRFPFSIFPLGTVWFLAKTVLFFPRHVLLQLITDLDESSQNRCKDMFSLIGNGQSVIDRCIAVLTLSQRHTAICK